MKDSLQGLNRYELEKITITERGEGEHKEEEEEEEKEKKKGKGEREGRKEGGRGEASTNYRAPSSVPKCSW